MRTLIALTIIALTITGCATSTEPRSPTSAAASTASRPSRTSGPAATSPAAKAGTTGSSAGSDVVAFCQQARRMGLHSLGPTAASPGHSVAAQLAGIDRLTGIAPAAVRADFIMFDRFEHAVVKAAGGRGVDVASLNTPRLSAALRHVGSYLVGTCHIPQ